MADKSCKNCHYGNMVQSECPGLPCFKNWDSCFDNPNHPEWIPETNGDKVREMTDEEPMELWGVTRFDDEYLPACATGSDERCIYVNFTCDACPKTFYNWLKAEAEE